MQEVQRWRQSDSIVEREAYSFPDPRTLIPIFTSSDSGIYVVCFRDLRYHIRMKIASLFPRRIEPRIAEALLDTPVVLLAGPRQAGKTTLVRQIAEQQGLRYLTMDDD